MREITECAAEQRGEQAEQRELGEKNAQQKALRRTQATHHRAGVEVTLHITARCQRDGDRGEHHGKQRRQAKELLRAIERRADFGTRVLRILDALAACQRFLDARTKRGDHRRFAGQQQAMANPTARLNQRGRWQVGEIHQQARRDGKEIDAAIGLERQHGADAQGLLADRNHVADIGRQCRSEPLVDPDRPRRRNAARRRVGRALPISDAQAAAQRIALGDCLEFSQLGALPLPHHAREGSRFSQRQAVFARLCGDARRPRMIGSEQQIGAEQLIGLALERLTHAVGKKSDGSQRRHRDHQRRDQQAQFAGASIAAQHAQRKRQMGH